MMKKKMKYSDESMQNAIQAVKKGISCTKASKQFGVPLSTLSDKIAGRSSMDSKMGAPTILSSDEEKRLVKWIKDGVRQGLPPHKRDILLSVQQIVKTSENKTRFQENDGKPGKSWWKAFKGRYTELSIRNPERVSKMAEGPKCCADPIFLHRGQKCTKGLKYMTNDMIEKHPSLMLTRNDSICNRCLKVLSQNDKLDRVTALNKRIQIKQKYGMPKYKKKKICLDKQTLRKAATIRITKQRQVFAAGSKKDMQEIYERCADPFLYHRAQRCRKNLTHVSEELMEKYPILLLTPNDQLCPRCLSNLDSGLDLNSIPEISNTPLDPSPEYTARRENPKLTINIKNNARREPNEECADPLLRHMGRQCTKGLEPVPQDIIDSHPLLLLTVHDLLCRACKKVLKQNSIAKPNDDFLYNYNSDDVAEDSSESDNESSSSETTHFQPKLETKSMQDNSPENSDSYDSNDEYSPIKRENVSNEDSDPVISVVSQDGHFNIYYGEDDEEFNHKISPKKEYCKPSSPPYNSSKKAKLEYYSSEFEAFL